MGGQWARVRKRRGGRASATLRGPETPRPLTGRYRRSNSDLMRNKVAAGARSAQPRTNSRAFRGISRNRKRPPARLGREISPTPAHRARERRQALRSESKKGVGWRTVGFFAPTKYARSAGREIGRDMEHRRVIFTMSPPIESAHPTVGRSARRRIYLVASTSRRPIGEEAGESDRSTAPTTRKHQARKGRRQEIRPIYRRRRPAHIPPPPPRDYGAETRRAGIGGRVVGRGRRWSRPMPNFRGSNFRLMRPAIYCHKRAQGPYRRRSKSRKTDQMPRLTSHTPHR